MMAGSQKGLRPFFGFYGGKWRDARSYPAPMHRTVVEPFAGSAGFSVRHAHLDIVLCEADPVIASVWTYLTKVKPKEILKIPDVPLNGTVEDLNLVQEAEWLVGFWLNRGAPRPRKRPSKWMRDRIRPGSFWGDRARETIASQVEYIRHWKVHNCSYEHCPVLGPATWFVDAPYQRAGKHYVYGSEGLDFNTLGHWCRSRAGQVIVCEGAGADWLPFRGLAEIKTTRAGRRSKEVVWIKEDSGE